MDSTATGGSISVRFGSTRVLRDRDAIYGEAVQRRIQSLGIEGIVTAPRSPRQNPFVERIIGSIRRDCLDHVTVLNERHLRRTLREYFCYYHTCRTHLSLNKDPPDTRTVEPPELGNIFQEGQAYWVSGQRKCWYTLFFQIPGLSGLVTRRPGLNRLQYCAPIGG